MGSNEHNGDFWLRLDNAAKIYPAVKDRELTTVFRIGVKLKNRVRVKPLLETIHEMEDRFPYYKVRLRSGFFWYYLEPLNLPITVIPDKGIPCRVFEKNELMFRVLVHESTINVEFSHILTDATGAFEFLKTLLLVYLEKSGHSKTPRENYLHPQDLVNPEEYEDAYKRYFKKIQGKRAKMPRAFRIPFRLKSSPRFDALIAEVPIASIIKKAKAYEVSLTEYLAAVYAHALQSIYRELSPLKKRRSSRIIRIEVPVNLRRLFPTKTMRNFSLFVMPAIDLRLGDYSFEEILKFIHLQMQLETDQKLISKIISRNVSGEQNVFLRRVPLAIKSFILSRLYARGTAEYSGVVTNLGRIDLDPEVSALIDRFHFIPPPPNKTLRVNCGVVGFDGKLVISFGNITTSKELERKFFTFLVQDGIPVRILNQNHVL